MKYLKQTDLSKVNNIVLIHLSDRNSHEKEFIIKMQENGFTQNLTVANNGMVMNFDKTPF
jgi:ribonuclease BN (tRNA processing enzyme)